MTPVQQLGGQAAQGLCLVTSVPGITRALSADGVLGNPMIQQRSVSFEPRPARPRNGPAGTRGRREVELQWRRAHPDALRPYAGLWVVLEKERIVAAGRSVHDVVTQARADGVAVPYVFRVDDTPEGVETIGL